MYLDIIDFLSIFFVFCTILGLPALRKNGIMNGISHKNYLKLLFASFFIFFVSFYVLRDSNRMSTDTQIYIRTYIESYNANTPIDNPYLEKGYLLLLYLLSRITGDYRFFLLVISCFIYYSFLSYIFKTSTNIKKIINSIILFVLLGTFFYTTHLMRQYLAISIILFSYNYLYRQEYFKFYIFVVTAFFFHSSSIVFAIMPLVNYIALTRRNILIFLTILLVIAPLGSKLITAVIPFLGSKYEVYFSSSRFGIQENAKLAPIMLLLISILLLFFFYLRINNKNAFQIFLIKVFAVGCIFTTLSFNFTQIGRVADYFIPASFPLFSQVKKDGFYYFVFFILLAECIIVNTFRGWNGFFPYKFM